MDSGHWFFNEFAVRASVDMYHPLGLQLRDAVVGKKTSYLSPGRVPIRFGLALLRHGLRYSRLASNSLGS